jgi:hypothetical protein
MDFWKQWTGAAVTQQQGAGPSLLADYQSYASKGPDVEAGGAPSTSTAATASAIFNSAGEGAGKVAGFLQQSLQSVSTSAQGAVTSVATGEAFRWA